MSFFGELKEAAKYFNAIMELRDAIKDFKEQKLREKAPDDNTPNKITPVEWLDIVSCAILKLKDVMPEDIAEAALPAASFALTTVLPMFDEQPGIDIVAAGKNADEDSLLFYEGLKEG